jgi:DNA (cytosine-5)-methyltransferase 1
MGRNSVRPRVIMLENVEEFAQWGPLVGNPDELRPCKKRRGQSFRKWVRSLVRLGYTVEYRELRACDYGAPTIRKRFFLIARRDGKPIVWPEPTHGPGLKPYRTAAECIDWSIPMCSVFATKSQAVEWAQLNGQKPPQRPLAENTMRRIARGVERFVLKNPEPFLVMIAHGDGTDRNLCTDKPLNTITSKNSHALIAPCITGVGGRQGQSPDRSLKWPLQTITAKGDSAIVAAHILSYHTEKANEKARGQGVDEPVATIDCSNRHSISMAFLAQNNGGFYDGAGHDLTGPLPTVLANGRGHQGLMAVHIQRDFSASVGHRADEPLATVMCEAGGKARDRSIVPGSIQWH